MVPPMTLDVRRSFSFFSFHEYILTINQMPELLPVSEGYTLRADAALKVLTPDGLPVKIWPITYAAVGSVWFGYISFLRRSSTLSSIQSLSTNTRRSYIYLWLRFCGLPFPERGVPRPRKWRFSLTLAAVLVAEETPVAGAKRLMKQVRNTGHGLVEYCRSASIFR